MRFVARPEEDGVERAELPVTIRPDVPGGDATKASLLHDVETRGSGALVLVFRSGTRQLDSYRFFSQDELDGQAGAPLHLRVPLTRCDFYILGNLNAVSLTDGRISHLMEALGADFPTDEDSLEALVYRLDGGSLNAAWRRERFAEVAACGIPYMHVSKGVDTPAQLAQGQGIPGSDRCRRLFSKVTVRIDHAAFDDGGAEPARFVNARLFLRQANARLQPFSESPQRAAEAVDVLAESDYDPEMASSNASVTTFSFYVPENRQGTLLPGNADSRSKTPDELTRQGQGSVVPFLTYVEFAGRLDPAAGGYGGEVTYRFYPGADNCTNFDLERGREYEISLSFRIGSLFEPDWKVQPGDWSDRRLFCLTADPGFADRLPEGRTLAVRAGRPGALYVYMNPSAALGSTNALLGREIAGSTAFVPKDVTDCAWYGDLMTPGTEVRAWLDARGIMPAWDKTAGRLTLVVTDPARFHTHVGESRSVSLQLLPAGGTVSFTVSLLPDISVTVADGLSLTEGFYLGQRRRVTVSGFAGSTVCYAADQDPCGRSASGAAHTANVQWKASSSASDPFPTVRTDAAGHVVLRPAEYPGQRLSGSTLDVYAFYPNHFQASHAGWHSKDGKILFFSEDYLNDAFELPVRISEPQLRVNDGGVILPIDGTEIQTDCGWWSFDGSVRLTASSFDPVLLSSRLALTLSSWTGSHAAWMDCLSLDAGTGLMSVRRTTSSEGKLEERDFSRTNGAWSTSLGRVEVRSAVLPELFRTPSPFALWVSALHIDRLRSGAHCTIDQDGKVFQSDYFNGSAADQLEEDGKFSMGAEFSFVGGDLSRIEWVRTGNAMSYPCSWAPYETIQPVIDFTVDVPDTGSGGSFSWVYDESRQVTVSSSGEPVPGGLILPYDTQTMTGTVTNRWDGRRFTTRVSFDLTYPVITANLLVVARPGVEHASVWLMPYKITRYLLRIGKDVDTAARRRMMQLFGRGDWPNYIYTSNRYRTRSGLNAYHSPGSWTGTPLTDYSIKYLWEFLYNNTGVSAWTREAVERLTRMYPSDICNMAYLDFNLYNTKFFHQFQQDPVPKVIGIWWTKGEAFL